LADVSLGEEAACQKSERLLRKNKPVRKGVFLGKSSGYFGKGSLSPSKTKELVLKIGKLSGGRPEKEGDEPSPSRFGGGRGRRIGRKGRPPRRKRELRRNQAGPLTRHLRTSSRLKKEEASKRCRGVLPRMMEGKVSGSKKGYGGGAFSLKGSLSQEKRKSTKQGGSHLTTGPE